jgi:hypothetical protein
MFCAASLSCALIAGGCGDDDGGDESDGGPDSGIDGGGSGGRDSEAGRGGRGGRGGSGGDGEAGRGGRGGRGGSGGAAPDDAGTDADTDADTDEDASTQACADDNGGCDALTTCTDGASGAVCGDCPAGYEGDGESGCIPALSALAVSAGALSPAFDQAQTNYALAVGLVTQRIALTPTAPDDATIDINGTAVDSGTAWQSGLLPLGDTAIVITVAQTGRDNRVYTVTVTRSIGTSFLKASNAELDDNLRSVALSGDTLVVGAPGEDSNAVDVNGNEADDSAGESGAAYVFVRTGGTWSQQAYLKAGNTDAGDLFGASVAISGDTIVVGALGEASNATTVDGDETNDTAPGAGAAYVFVRSGSTWSPQAYLKASNTDAGDGFGGSVGIDGDTIVVGAELEDSSAVDVGGDATSNGTDLSGAAYVFVRSGVAWSQQAYLKAGNTGVGDEFGAAVAISGDTIAVGARLEDSNATTIDGDETNDLSLDSGAVYLFTRSATTWAPQAYVKAPNNDPADEFGISVALSGDTLAIGASLESSNATTVGGDQSNDAANDAGAAYVFVRSAGAWSLQAYLKASNAEAGDTFGRSIALDGDAIVVGARLEDGGATGVNGADNNDAPESGAAYLFQRTGTAWAQTAYLKASNTQTFDEFSQGVAISGDTIAITASEEDSSSAADPTDNSAFESGALYVIR